MISFYQFLHGFRDLSVESLRYLTSEQALADLATFRQAFNAKYGVADDSKWISFGGSYPGKRNRFRLKSERILMGLILSQSINHF